MSLRRNESMSTDGPRHRGEETLAQRRVCDLEGRLHRAGVGIRLRRLRGRPVAHGANIEVNAATAASCAAMLTEAASSPAPASLHIGVSIEGACGPDVITAFEEAEQDLGRITLTVDVDGASSLGCFEGLRAIRPCAERLVFVGQESTLRLLRANLHLMHGPAAKRSGWSIAWHACVRSHCPLLPAESTRTLIAGPALAAPSRTAWLPMSLDITRYAKPNGDIDSAVLAVAMDACVEAGDQLLDHLHWSCPRQREDARLNRRLAIHLTGLGELVSRRRLDPSSLACLRELDGLVSDVHEGLWRRSRRLASLIGAAPVLTEHQPTARWRDEAHRRDWSQRWCQAVSRAQVRHRNLLVLSPASLLPVSRAADPGFADLLPLLAHADALSFLGGPCVNNWAAADRKRYLQRLHAQVGRFNATSFIAAGA